MDSSKGKVLIVAFGYVFSEPPSRNAMLSFIEAGYQVSVLHLKKFSLPSNFDIIENIEIDIQLPKFLSFIKPVYRVFEWIGFRNAVNRWVSSNPGSIVWHAHLSPVAALNRKLLEKKNCIFICNVVDVPPLRVPGKFEQYINKTAWKKLSLFDLVVSSDYFKAQQSLFFAQLEGEPMVCHNTPRLEEFKNIDRKSNKTWLRNELIKQGASLETDEGVVMLRAGAIGELGGIEETMQMLRELPEELIFLMMGRPTKDYENHIRNYIKELKLEKRVFLWLRPSDDIWKKALLGADIGHLIHICPLSGYYKSLFELNSSLSNNRLFQYMAAGLPIVSYLDPRMQKLYGELDGFVVVDAQNLVSELCKKIPELNNEERNRLGQNNRTAYLKTYNWENQFAPILRYVRKQHFQD